MALTSRQMPWVIFKVMKEPYAVQADYVREMVRIPPVTPVPNTPEFLRGVINLRGKVIPVIDFRVKLGAQSQIEETMALISLLSQREEDHKNWIAELAQSVKEKRAFTLATDPHQCKFGQWYDHFTTDNRLLAACLKEFEVPHNTIHSIAAKVKEFERQQDFDSAFALIDRTRNRELTRMIQLFGDARSLLTEGNREIAVILEFDSALHAISVDSVETVEPIAASDIDELPETLSPGDNHYVSGIGKRQKGERLVQLLAVEKLIRYDA
jgi:chemotaxis signal transduction protein